MSEQREHQQRQQRRFRIAGRDDSAPDRQASAHVEDLVDAYALGALDPEESATVDAHVHICNACSSSLIAAQRTAGMLSFLAPSHTPAPDVKAALFARVARTQRAAAQAPLPVQGLDVLRTPTLPRSDAFERDLVYAPAGAAVAAAAAPAARSPRMGWLVSAVSMPLLVALIATGFWGLQLRQQISSQDAKLAELQSELTNFGYGATSYSLSPGGAAPQAEGRLVLGADQRAGTVQIDVNSDQGPRSFELLVNRDGQLVPAGEIQVNQAGQGQAQFELDQPFNEYESVHIKAKPLDAADIDQADTLQWGSEGSLGSTGSGLEVGP